MESQLEDINEYNLFAQKIESIDQEVNKNVYIKVLERIFPFHF